jgi:hypothetical protein
MKRFVFLVLLLFSSSAYADTSSLNLQLPNSSGTHSSDKFKSGDMDCSNAIDGSTKFEFGVTGLIDNYQSPFGERNGMTEKDVGVFARIVIPLDGPAERINCNTLYQLELKKKRLEIEKLERELSKLRSLQTAE